MNKPTLYKKEPLSAVRNRTTTALSADEKTRVNTVVSKFFELFTDKHL